MQCKLLFTEQINFVPIRHRRKISLCVDSDSTSCDVNKLRHLRPIEDKAYVKWEGPMFVACFPAPACVSSCLSDGVSTSVGS